MAPAAIGRIRQTRRGESGTGSRHCQHAVKALVLRLQCVQCTVARSFQLLPVTAIAAISDHANRLGISLRRPRIRQHLAPTRRSCHLASPESPHGRIRLLANPLSERMPSEVSSTTAHLPVARIDGVRAVQPGRRSQARTARKFLHVVRELPCLVRTIKCELTVLLRTDAN